MEAARQSSHLVIKRSTDGHVVSNLAEGEGHTAANNHLVNLMGQKVTTAAEQVTLLPNRERTRRYKNVFKENDPHLVEKVLNEKDLVGNLRTRKDQKTGGRPEA